MSCDFSGQSTTTSAKMSLTATFPAMLINEAIEKGKTAQETERWNGIAVKYFTERDFYVSDAMASFSIEFEATDFL